MRANFVSTLLFLMAFGTISSRSQSARAADSYSANPGPEQVATLEADWHDPARDMTVPVKLYYPKDIASPKDDATPIIIFSHGLGGSREGYGYWAEYWASFGYVVVLPTHVGSDTSLITGGRGAGGRGFLHGRNSTDNADATQGNTAGAAGRGVMDNLRSGISRQSAENRYKDVSFVLDVMQKANAGAADADPQLALFKSKLDMHHIGMAGHSFGAQTTLMEAGEQPARAAGASPRDDRITAAIAMSPQPALALDQDRAFGAIKIPVMHITGTEDSNPPGLGDVKPADRRVPFDHSAFPQTYLIIFKGATHMTFAPVASGATIGARFRQMRAATQSANTPEQETTIHEFTREATTAFWDATLKSDTHAHTWLITQFPKLLGDAGTFETREK
jgi:predicted dienelactone hydrolase